MPNLPRSQSSSQSIEPLRSHPKKTCILLVEDEETVRKFVRVVLEHSGYEVITARDGDQGFAEFMADSDRFNLILTDVIMPNRNGVELVDLIRHVRPDVPVIFMSAYPGGVNCAPIELPSGVALLEKPFSLDQLLHNVTQAIGQRVGNR